MENIIYLIIITGIILGTPLLLDLIAEALYGINLHHINKPMIDNFNIAQNVLLFLYHMFHLFSIIAIAVLMIVMICNTIAYFYI